MRSKKIRGLNKSLHFVSFKKLSKFSNRSRVKIKSDFEDLFKLIERVIYDQKLDQPQERLARFVRILHALKLHFIPKLIPTNFQPMMGIEASKFSS